MAEENQVTKEPQGKAQRVMKEPQGEATQVQRVTTKNPKEVEAGKRLAENNHKKREVKKQAKLEARGVNQYCGIGAVLALGVIGGLGYCIYRTKKVEQPQGERNKIILNHTHNHRPTSLRWIKSFLYYKMHNKSIVNDLYQAAVISVLAVGYSSLERRY